MKYYQQNLLFGCFYVEVTTCSLLAIVKFLTKIIWPCEVWKCLLNFFGGEIKILFDAMNSFLCNQFKNVLRFSFYVFFLFLVFVEFVVRPNYCINQNMFCSAEWNFSCVYSFSFFYFFFFVFLSQKLGYSLKK